MAITFHDVLFSEEYSAIASGGPEFATALIGSDEGGAVMSRAEMREDYISQYSISYEELEAGKKKWLRTFSILRKGMACGFRFLAPDASKIESENVGKLNPSTAEIGRVALTDGSTKEFFIIEYLSDAANNYLRWITKPSPLEDWTITIRNSSGIVQAQGIFPGGYNYNPFEVLPVTKTITLPTYGKVTLYYGLGKIYFQTNLPANLSVDLTGSYHLPVAFMDDLTNFEIDEAAISELKVQIKEILPIELGLSPEIVIASPFAPPTLTVASPAPGNKSGNYIVSTTVTGSIIGLRLLVDGELYGAEDAASPWEITLNCFDVADGVHTLQTYGRDGNGNLTYSNIVTITVVNDYTPPTVSISADSVQPPLGYTGTIKFTATAADNVAINRVEFYRDGGAFLSSDSSSPYELNFNTTTVANGTHSIQAIAFDTSGNQSTAASITFQVNN